MNLYSYPDKSVDVDVYFVMLDPQGNIYSGMTWKEGLTPVVKGLTIPPDLQFDDIPILEISIPNVSPPIIMPGKHTFALALFKTGTAEMLMFLAKTSFNLAE